MATFRHRDTDSAMGDRVSSCHRPIENDMDVDVDASSCGLISSPNYSALLPVGLDRLHHASSGSLRQEKVVVAVAAAL
jgi:hypothetical protein